MNKKYAEYTEHELRERIIEVAKDPRPLSTVDRVLDLHIRLRFGDIQKAKVALDIVDLALTQREKSEMKLNKAYICDQIARAALVGKTLYSYNRNLYNLLYNEFGGLDRFLADYDLTVADVLRNKDEYLTQEHEKSLPVHIELSVRRAFIKQAAELNMSETEFLSELLRNKRLK
ncbi:MAG: hypothetical protein ACRDD4_02165 [Culicoidibacterales bacterium]